MPVITFNKKYLAKLMSVKLTDKQLSEEVEKMGFNVEGINELEVSLEITPNRPDLYGAVGLARSLKNFLHRSRRFKYELEDGEPAFEIDVGREVGKLRPFISGFAAYGLSLSDEALVDIMNFAEKLSETYGRSRRKAAVGIYDLGQIEPPLHYNAYGEERFTPLGESSEMTFTQTLKSTEKGAKYGGIISNVDGRYPALKDNIGVISLIPVINAERTRVTRRTKDVFVEMTGTDKISVNKALDMFAAVFMDLGAKVAPVEINYPGSSEATPIMKSQDVKIPLQLSEREIGVKIGYNNIISLANKMGYEAALIGSDVRFRVPEYRIDVMNDQDIVEDIAIAYGYDYIQPIPILSAQKGELERKTMLFEELSDLMVGMGFSEEVSTYLTNEKANFSNMGIKDTASYLQKYGIATVNLKNARAGSITMMRTWVLPSLLKALGASGHEKMPQKLFELDMVFYLSRNLPVESYHLSGVYADPKSNFNQVKGIVDSLANSMRLDWRTERYEHESFIRGRCAKVTSKGRFAGFFGELHPEALKNFSIEEPASAFELDLSFLINQKAQG